MNEDKVFPAEIPRRDSNLFGSLWRTSVVDYLVNVFLFPLSASSQSVAAPTLQMFLQSSLGRERCRSRSSNHPPVTAPFTEELPSSPPAPSYRAACPVTYLPTEGLGGRLDSRL